MDFVFFSVWFWIVFQTAESGVDVGIINCRQNVASIGCPANTTCFGTCRYTCQDIPRKEGDGLRQVWGTKIYTSNSSICKAAAHDLRISTWDKTQMSFILQRIPYDENYWASVRCDIRSYSYPKLSSSENDSFIFLNPRIKENILDVASLHEAFLFSEAEFHVQRCLASNNRISFSFKNFIPEESYSNLRTETESWGTLTVYKMRWPQVNGEAQSGGFRCVPENSMLSALTSLAMNANADFYPTHMTYVANVNENVTLVMKEHSEQSSSCASTWKKDDERLPGFISQSAQQPRSLFLPSVQEGNQGLYSLECNSNSTRRGGGLLRLIVRGCSAGKYGNNCTEQCPECGNGGVCHDVTGVCICPPGFNGATCEKACPAGFFGQACSMSCPVKATPLGRKPSCKGFLICLADPYGCSCASGYKGIFCNESCARGEYGAGCTQIECHCLDGKTCDVRFPVCSSGCLSGWHGDTCNISYPVLTDEVILKEFTSNSIMISFRAWNSTLDIGNGTPATYKVYYKKNNNQETWVSKDVPVRPTGEKEHYRVNLENLAPATEYAVRVVILDKSGRSQEEEVKENLFSTSCGPPMEPPLNVNLSAEEREVFVTWELPPSKYWNCKTIKSIVKYNNRANVLEEKSINGTSYSFTSKPFTKWNITVCLGQESEDPKCAETESVTTKEDAPGIVRSFSYINVRSRSIVLTWSDPIEKNGVIRYYTLTYQQISWTHGCRERFNESIKTLNISSGNGVSVRDLNPSARYSFQLFAVTVKEGPKKDLDADTKVDVPSSSVGDLRFQPPETLIWSEPPCRESNGKIVYYRITVTGLSASDDHYERSITTRDINSKISVLPFTMYNAKVFASTDAGIGDNYAEITFTTPGVEPKAPASITVSFRTENYIRIQWEPPLNIRYLTRNYFYMVNLFLLKSASSARSGYISEDERSQWQYVRRPFTTFYNLRPATVYILSVRIAVSSSKEGPALSKIVETTFSAPKVSRVPVLIGKTEDTITIKVFPVEPQDGIIRYYFVVIKVVETENPGKTILSDGPEEIFFAPTNCHVRIYGNRYVTARLESMPPGGEDFTVGDGRCISGYSNQPLSSGTYQVGIAVLGEYRNNKRYSSVSYIAENILVEPPPKTDVYTIVLGVLIAFIVIVFILIGIFAMPARFFQKARRRANQSVAMLPWRRRRRPPAGLAFDNAISEDEDDDSCIDTESIGEDISFVIAVKDLENYVTDSLRNGDLKKQFKALPRGQKYSSRTARLPHNRLKNRYGNLLPYDHSRVKLESTPEDPSSGYINANYVCGYKTDKKYIATQGPLPKTVTDFWKMVWKENSCKIFMVTNLVEQGRVKCEKYWPDETAVFGVVTVTLKNSEPFADFVIRTFEIRLRKQKRELKQYHYLTWPDHGAPAYAASVIRFLKKARDYQPDSGAPIIVHCSAGVGRTGTIILLDSILEMGMAEGKIDVCGHLCEMRKKRVNLLENMEQYSFVYKALEQSLCWGETSVPCAELVPQIGSLRKPDGDGCFSPLEMQYKRLGKICPNLDNVLMRVARLPENVPKNRTMKILPPERARPILKSTLTGKSSEASTYINAVYVNGYKEKDTFLVTQYPLPNTVPDFWQMIYEKKSRTIVLLQDIDFTDPTCPQYWPSEGQAVAYGEYEVHCTSVKLFGDIRMWNLNLSSMNAKESSDDSPVPIKLFHHLCWTVDQPLPQYPKSILELIDKVERTQREGKHVVTVQCLNGSTACGVFCAAMFMCSKMINEQEVDIFLAVQNVRANRPQLIESFEQYDYLCDVAIAFLDNFETYANFL